MAALSEVGMDGFAGYYPGQLSIGMKQRINMARGIALDTGILLMDEPFAALDEQTRLVLGEDLSVLLARTCTQRSGQSSRRPSPSCASASR